jgi:two-component system cell cycle sensor histidine kinase PleC
MAHERGVDIKMSVDDGFPRLRIDEDLLEGVLGDLVSNAIKFTPSGGRVTLHARQSDDGESAIFVISDTGVGMTPETLVRVMRSLPVEPETGPHGDTGNGLGLGLVKARLASLGIQLELRSSVTAGTAVVLTFPGALTDPH